MNKRLLKEGHNCWRISRANKLAMLYDGENYFNALFNTLPKAKSSIQIFGWEVDARVGMDIIHNKYPGDLREYFSKLADAKGLLISVSSWKPALYLKFDREFFAPFKWWKNSSTKVHYRQLRTPTTFSSYHEKVCLIDNNLCYLGGMDITKRRWDTQEHDPKDEHRVDASGNKYNPVHDVQIAISGEITSLVSKCLNGRLYQVPNQANKVGKEVWPSTHRPQLENVELGLARTSPTERAFEIENFYHDSISSAQNYIFIENQYFSHRTVIELLCEKLLEPNGPEVLIVLPFSYPGFFERAIFTRERRRAIKKLEKHDRYNRLLVLYPKNENTQSERYTVVHSKLMAVDGKYLTIGSANLNYRSFRVDNELNVCLESQSQEEILFIKGVVESLVSEHLHTTTGYFKETWEAKGSLVKSVKALMGKDSKTLEVLPLEDNPLKEKVFFWLLPFVDIKFRWPKSYFNLAIILAIAGLIFAAKAIYET